MKKEIKIPDIAENVDEGVIGRILVSKGDQVKEDQPVVEVETDKAATDIPSPYTGTIDEIKVEEGDEVTVDQVIMIVEVKDDGDGDADTDEKDDDKADQAEEGTEKKKEQDDEGGEDTAGEETEAEESGKKEKAESGEGESEKDEDDEEAPGKEDEGIDEDSEEPGESEEADKEDGEDEAPGEDEEQKKDEAEKQPAASGQKTAGEDIPAAPSVRRMAREAGVDISEIKGSGPGSRITAEDIEAAKETTKKEGEKKKGAKPSGEKKKAGAADRESAIELPDFSKWGETKKEKMNTVRKITARTMTASWQQIPQVTQFDEADITDIEAFRQQHKDDYEKQGGKLTVTAILLKIAAFALQKFPRFNSSIDTSDNILVMKQYINIGVAVDTDKGLIVPVIRDTDKKSLADISVETVELAKKARENEISSEELQGGNFTISNLGGIGGTGFTPIVYAPQVAILGVSKASYKQVFMDDRFQQRLVLPLSVTYDHRVIDGADGARFLKWICDVLEDPYALLM